jgi:HK97 family phage prohead protease
MSTTVLTRTATVEIVEATPRSLVGVAVPFGERTVVFDPRANTAIVEQFKRGSMRIPDFQKTLVPLLVSHRDDKPIGRLRAARDTAAGLEIDVELVASRQERAGIAARIEGGTMSSMSIGFTADERADEWSRDALTGLPAVVRRNATLVETSLCVWPAYRKAMVLDLRDDDTDPAPARKHASDLRLWRIEERHRRRQLDERIDRYRARRVCA